MASKIFTGTYATTQTLTTGFADATVAATGRLNAGLLATTYHWYIQNFGEILATNATAMQFNHYGEITNHAGGVISGTGTNSRGVVLNGSDSFFRNAVINQASATVSGQIGILGMVTNSVIQNAGTISGTGTASFGVSLQSGGKVTNQSGGTIIGATGLAASGAPTVINQGTITGTGSGASYFGVSLGAIGTLTNSGTVTGYSGVKVANVATVNNTGSIGATGTAAAGVTLAVSSVLTNQSSGTITGGFGVVAIGAVNIQNAGKITGTAGKISTGVYGSGIALQAGGTVTNLAGATISSGYYGVYGSGAAMTLTNAGIITAGNAGVVMRGGGLVSNQAAGLLTGPQAVYVASGQLLNAGQIYGSFAGVKQGGGSATNQSGGTISSANWGVAAGGGTFTNQSGGSISGLTGVFVTQGLFTNQSGGVVHGNVAAQLNNAAFGTLVNAGQLSGSAYGILGSTNTVATNQSGGTIIGGIAGARVGLLSNAGSISGTGSAGVMIYSNNAKLTNLAGGVISGPTGAYAGLYDKIIIENAGTISGTTTALVFEGGSEERLIVDPGAVFVGTVDGDGGGKGTDSTLEFASGTGTASGSLAPFINFKTIVVDAAANWQFASGGTVSGVFGVSVASNATLTNAGSIAATDTASAGVTLAAGDVLTNQSNGTISGAIGVLATGAVTVSNAGHIIGNGGTVHYDPITYTATYGSGISLQAGGIVTNLAGATISGGYYGVYGSGAAMTLTNAGIITASTDGVVMRGGGLVSNQAIGLITGSEGIFLNGGQLLNAGNIYGGFVGVEQGGGSVTNQSGGTISGSVRGVLSGGGTFTNQSGGSISALSGVVLNNGIFTNQSGGVVSGNVAAQLLAAGFGTLVNAGQLSGTAYGILGSTNNFTTNQSGGTVTGGIAGARVRVLSNAGSISGGTLGVWLYNSSEALTNLASGIISGPTAVLTGNYGNLTIENAGTISGTTLALQFAGGSGNRLIVDPGAVFAGTVDGDASGAGSSTLEFTSGTGTASGSLAPFINFTSVVVDASANWRFAAAGTVSSYNGVSVASNATLTNAGTITATGAGSVAVTLADSAVLTNLSTGTISGGHDGVRATGTTTLNNAGTIESQGASSYGIHLKNSFVTNQSSGRIDAPWIAAYLGYGQLLNAGNISSANFGAVLVGASATNQSGGTINANVGVYIISNGTRATLTNQSGGTITGGVVVNDADFTNQSGGVVSGDIGVSIFDILASGASSTVVNGGLISATSQGISASQIGSATVLAGGVVTGGIFGARLATLTNAGSVSGGQAGVALSNGNERLTNQVGGIISGPTAVAGGTQAIVDNAGTLSGSSYALKFTNSNDRLIERPGAVLIGNAYGGGGIMELASAASAGTLSDPGAQITNFATIAVDSGATWSIYNSIASGTTLVNDGTLNAAVTLGAGATLLNNSDGDITATGLGAVIATGSVSIANGGSINGGVAGLLLYGGGQITNAASSTLAGSIIGVYAVAGATTVTNAGSIGGGVNALLFAPGVTNRLIVDPGAVFSGTVDGGNTISAGFASTLELAGTAAGTLAGLGSQFINFATVVVDAAANWTLSGDSLASGYSVIDNGTLTNSGTLRSAVTVGSGAMLTNASGGLISVTGTAAAVYGSTISSPATVANAGTISGGAQGVSLRKGGLVTNLGGAAISGGTGIYVAGATGTLVNAGRISGTAGNAVTLARGGAVTNAAGGTISGSSGAVQFAPGFAGLLALDPTSVISGQADGGNAPGGTIVSTLELMTGAAAGTLSGLGSSFTNFGRVTVDAGATWTLTGESITSTTTLIDNGMLINAGSLATGVTLGSGAILNNQAGATITVAGGIVTGLGAVRGTASGGGTVTNAGLIAATNTVTGRGVYLTHGGLVTNSAGGTIKGISGIAIYGGAATVMNAGTIIGTSGGAVRLASGFIDRLVLSPGAVISGSVNGGNTIGATASSTLELASGASAGTLSGFGAQFTNFSQIAIDASASWTLTGGNTLAAGTTLTNGGTFDLLNATLSDSGVVVNNSLIVIDPSNVTLQDLNGTGTVVVDAGSTLTINGTVASTETIDLGVGAAELIVKPTGFSGVIDGFNNGDTISVSTATDATGAHLVGTNTLRLERSSHPAVDLSIDPNTDLSLAAFQVSTVGTGALITIHNPACFVTGTLIDTPEGPVAVETLREGDLVLTASGGTRPVHWLGWRHIDLTRHPDPRLARPIRIMANALGDAVPRRDLLVSGDHALLLDGVLIAARQLVNGATIRRETACLAVTYYHVELDAHDVLLAEGAPAESYLDTGNRGVFENGGAPLVLHPDLDRGDDQARRVAGSCAPLVDDVALVEPIWRRLAERADQLGLTRPMPTTTDDPELVVVLGDRVVRPVTRRAGRYVFVLPASDGPACLVSRNVVPNEARPWQEDRRRLGVMVQRLSLTRGDRVEVISPDHPALTHGWWAAEGDGYTHWRWTDGAAALPVALGEASILEVKVAGGITYAEGIDLAA